jgi:hypothetical protein
MKEIVDRNLKLFSDRALTQQSHYDATDMQLAACKFFSLASKLKRAIASGNVASIAYLAWLLLHGREGLPQDQPFAFKMAEEGSRRGCPHSQGVLALCIVLRDFIPYPSSAANEATARRLANASAEAGSKYGQFALGCILKNETPNSVHHVAAPCNAQYALAAAQALDEAQAEWGRMLLLEAAESEEEEEGEARRLFLLAAAQGSHTACEQLLDLPLDEEEENYWRERIDSARNASFYSAGFNASHAAVAASTASHATSSSLLSSSSSRSSVEVY